MNAPGVYAGLDWLRVTAREQFQGPLTQFVESWFGTETSTTPGTKHFKAGLEWSPGVQFSWGHPSSICMLDVRGERFTMLGGDEGVRLLRGVRVVRDPCGPGLRRVRLPGGQRAHRAAPTPARSVVGGPDRRRDADRDPVRPDAPVRDPVA